MSKKKKKKSQIELAQEYGRILATRLFEFFQDESNQG